MGKWLVKERGDLIKMFSAGSGGGESPEVPLLLAGTSLRLSEMEHTLQRGEEVWRRLEVTQQNPDPQHTTTPSDTLQLSHGSTLSSIPIYFFHEFGSG